MRSYFAYKPQIPKYRYSVVYGQAQIITCIFALHEKIKLGYIIFGLK